MQGKSKTASRIDLEKTSTLNNNHNKLPEQTT